MQSNKLRMAIRATAAAAIFGVAGQAGAVSFDAGGWNTSVYGYARLNAVYDIDEDVGSTTQSGNFSMINTGAAENNEATGYFDADAVQSRIGVKTTSPEGVTFNIEGDFRNGTLRLRHGYGSYNGVLAGQTWSNYNSFVGNTATLDFDSLPGTAGYQGRTAQLRYTTGALSISAEDPQSSLYGAAATAAKKDGMPTFTIRLEDKAGGMSYSAAAVAHQVGYDTGTNDESAFGFGAFVAAKMQITDMIDIHGALNYSDGANSYLWRSGDNYFGSDAYIGANGDVETIAGYAGSIGTGINLGGGRSINIGYGMTTMDWDDAEDDGLAVGGETETNSAVMANYKWTPVKNVMMGVEYQYLKTEQVNGDDGDANRLMFAAQYNF
ncbi:DcaP family trimeric outer membrane transporter [Marinobacter sp.]|uniref:DcaP family trimeric outer membrane transporter n=1 Tax=Marinobacter sp. TaxID=50741 RepID=UPI001992D46F|nr:DcaP family trimeric outer membrane transporter [Marinobacter sp.]MBD3655945.1 hypothetical protein [Marinobacter sp.]